MQDVSDQDSSDEEESEEALEEEIDESEDEEEEPQIASAEENLQENQELALQSVETEDSDFLSAGVNPVTGNILNPVSSSSTINLVNTNNLGTVSSVSSLGTLAPVSNSLSLMGDNSLTGSIIETSSFDEVITENEEITESDDVVDDGQITYNQDETDTESQTEQYETDQSDDETDQSDDETDQSDDETDSASNEFLVATPSNDTLVGNQGTTQFLFDFSESSGGIDKVSDNGTNTDDRIYIKNIAENNALLFSRSSSNDSIQAEYFEYDGVGFQSVNTISTPISSVASGIGVEELHLSPFDNEYNETVVGEDLTSSFYNLSSFGSSNVYETALLVIGDNNSNTFLGNSPDVKNTFSAISKFGVGRYDMSDMTTKIVYSKGGGDDVDASSSHQTIAFLGAGNDFLDQHPDYNGEKTASDSYFHGGFGADELWFTENADHIGFNSTDYSDAFKPTNKAILTEEGNASNISNVGDSYFEAFETIYTKEGEDSFYFAGSTDNLITIYAGKDNDDFHFDTGTDLSNNFYAYGVGGDDEFKIGGNYGANTLYIDGAAGSDRSIVHDGVTSEVCVDLGESLDTYSFETAFSNPGLKIKNFNTTDDVFDFNSAAFAGNTGHTLVFGKVLNNEFMVNSTLNDENQFVLDAFDETDTRVSDLLEISDDRWYYDTNDGRLYYDEDADQFMEDAIEVARVLDESENPLDNTELQSSDILYDITSS